VVVRRSGYSYPAGIPAPIARDTRIVGRFNVVFK
jgi:hypothetical protein